ncbi:ribosome biogenesis GTPase Der [Candidatus Gracilibacteria bacterium]|nr:ribosome biogenesis GTPase Der [Candidatus Gracilibacteria bacterium]
MLGKVTIIGRPNVGKSSFFNMYTGHKIAIVDDESGTTRDISEFEYRDFENDLTYILSDSGGLDLLDKNDEISRDIADRTKKSIENSDLLIWLVEYDRITELDEQVLKIIRELKVKDFILVANKADNEQKKMEAYSIAGFANALEFFPVSVSHNDGIRDIKRFVAKFLESKGLNYKEEEVDDTYVKLALVGRPNVGKSSLINAIVGENRVMVRDMAGTTRDSIDTKFKYGDTNFVLIDTAGIRRLSKVGVRNVEDWSVMRTERSITRADIVAVVIDGFDGIVHQDLAIISTVLEENKGLIVVVNKWDKVLEKPGIDKDSIMNRYIEYLKSKVEFLPWASVVFTSAVSEKRLSEILENAKNIKLERFKRVKTGVINNFLEQVVLKHPPTGTRKSHNPKIYYGSQVDVNPPKFVLTVNNPEHFHFSYKRYLENRIRDNFGFFGTPIVIEYKGRGKTADKRK